MTPESESAAVTRRAVFHFVDGTQLTLEWPKKFSDDSRELAPALREAASSTHFAAEVDGRVVVIQMANVKFFEMVPAPERLPREWLRGAREVTST